MSLQGTLFAKYQLKPDIYVLCRLEIVDASERSTKVLIGIRELGDTTVGAGTRITIVPENMQQIFARRTQFELLYMTVQGLGIHRNRPVQLCSAISKDLRQNQRQQERTQTEFPITVDQLPQFTFTVREGNSQGLTVEYQSEQLFVGLLINQPYTLSFELNEHHYSFTAVLKHIHYNWQTFHHRLGFWIHEALDRDTEIALLKRIDPNFELTIKQKSTVDADEARIRSDML